MQSGDKSHSPPDLQWRLKIKGYAPGKAVGKFPGTFWAPAVAGQIWTEGLPKGAA